MATYCSNDLIISGDKTMLTKFILDHNIDEIDEENDYSSLVEIEDHVPLYSQKTERLNLLYPTKYYTLNYEDLVVYDTSIPDFSVLLPTPQEKNDYYWRVDHWGTEANSSEFEVKFEDEKLVIEFKTLWTPPKEWVVFASEYYSGLTFELSYFSDILEENGPKIWGSIECIDGKIVKENDYQREHLLSCPSLSTTLQRIKNLPAENSFPISDYITLLERIDPEDEICVYDIADNLSDELNTNQKSIMAQIASIWYEMIDKLDSSYSELRKMFPYYAEEILEIYKGK